MDSYRICKHLAYHLKYYRKKQGLTQAKLAELLQYSEKSVAKWESGTTLPSVETLSKIASYLGVKIDDLLKSPHRRYYLGIDGGGTKTHYLLCDEQSQVVAEYIGAGCNPFDIGVDAALLHLREGLDRVLGDVPPSQVSVFAGIAGAGYQKKQEQIKQGLSDYGFYHLDCDTDNENIITLGLGARNGMTLILGTGMCLYQVIGGVRQRKSGWGYLIDEGGSGYNFGIDAIRAYFAHIDGDEMQSTLFPHFEALGFDTPMSFLSQIYDGGKRYVASFAPYVLQGASQGDAVCCQIVDRNLECVIRLLQQGYRDFADEKKPVVCVLAGGIARQKQIKELLEQRMPKGMNIQFEQLQQEPVWGAVAKARAAVEQMGGKEQ